MGAASSDVPDTSSERNIVPEWGAGVGRTWVDMQHAYETTAVVDDMAIGQ